MRVVRQATFTGRQSVRVAPTFCKEKELPLIALEDVRSPLDKLVVGGECVFLTPDAPQKFRFLPIGKVVVRIKADELVIGRESLLVSPQIGKNLCFVRVGRRKIRGKFNGLLERL